MKLLILLCLSRSAFGSLVMGESFCRNVNRDGDIDLRHEIGSYYAVPTENDNKAETYSKVHTVNIEPPDHKIADEINTLVVGMPNPMMILYKIYNKTEENHVADVGTVAVPSGYPGHFYVWIRRALERDAPILINVQNEFKVEAGIKKNDSSILLYLCEHGKRLPVLSLILSKDPNNTEVINMAKLEQRKDLIASKKNG